MTIQTKTVIIGNFQNGDVPSGTNFADWIETCVTLGESSAQNMLGTLGVAVELTTPRVSAAVVTPSSSFRPTYVAASGAGTSQASAVTITVPYTRLTPTSADSGYIMPGGYPGDIRWMRNAAAVSAYIYPPSGGSINGLSSNTAYQLAGSARMMIVAETSSYFSTWRCTE